MISRMSGLTLIEMMVTVAILAIVVALAVPSMTDFMNSNRLTSHTAALKQAIQYARSEAVSKNQPVSVCASSDGVACTGNDTWNQGWIVFTNENSDGAVDAGTDTILRVWAALSDNFTVTGGATTTFSSTGERTTGSVTFQITDPAGENARNLAVNNVGWVTVSKVAKGGSGSGSEGSGGDATGGGS